MITSDLRLAISRAVEAAGYGAVTDPVLRPGGAPCRYSSAVAFRLAAARGQPAETIAKRILEALDTNVATAVVTGPGYLTLTSTPEATAALPARIAAAGAASANSDALAGRRAPAAPQANLATAPSWAFAKAALVAELTARLAVAAAAQLTERAGATPQGNPRRQAGGKKRREDGGAGRREGGAAKVSPPARYSNSPEEAVRYAGAEAVRLALARLPPGGVVAVDPVAAARHVPGNPAYAVRYAHARAASALRWAGRDGDPAGPALVSAAWRPADPGQLALLDALSWLPERVAAAARRGRPDEFVRYLEGLAANTIDIVRFTSQSHDGTMVLTAAARAGLAAGLGLLGADAPDRL